MWIEVPEEAAPLLRAVLRSLVVDFSGLEDMSGQMAHMHDLLVRLEDGMPQPVVLTQEQATRLTSVLENAQLAIAVPADIRLAISAPFAAGSRDAA